MLLVMILQSLIMYENGGDVRKNACCFEWLDGLKCSNGGDLRNPDSVESIKDCPVLNDSAQEQTLRRAKRVVAMGYLCDRSIDRRKGRSVAQSGGSEINFENRLSRNVLRHSLTRSAEAVEGWNWHAE